MKLLLPLARARALPSLVLLLTSLGCWAGRTSTLQGDDLAIIQQAQALARSDRMEAAAMLDSYLEKGQDEELLPIVALHAGEQRRLMGDPGGAEEDFRMVLDTWPDHAASKAASLGLALLEGESPSGNALATLKLMDDASAVDTMNADRYRLLALRTDFDGGSEETARGFARKALVYAQSDATVEARVRRDLAQWLDAEEFGDAPPVAVGDADALALMRAQHALDERRFDSAIQQAQALIDTFPDSTHVGAAEWVVKRAQAGDPYDPTRIGVLLPLSGTWAPPGKLLKQAFELAADTSGVEFVYRDTEGDLAKAEAAFEALVLKDGVAAVVGPLLKENAFPVAELAHDAGVPLVALTQAPGITEVGPQVYRGLMTVDQQIQGLLDHVMGVEGMSRFAVLAPDTPFGQNALDTFQRRVVERGGSITIHATYDPAETSFRASAAALGQKDYEARKSELYRLRKDAEENGMDPSKVVLPPRQEFDAIFIPDSYQRVALVAASLAYEEFAIGAFTPRRDDEPVPLLGLNGWHNDDLVNRGGKYTQASYFVDAYDPAGDDVATRSFISSYQAAYGRTPGVLEAMGYDAARLVLTTARVRPENRSTFLASLHGATIRDPVTRGDGFDENREIDREVLVFTISPGGIHRVGDPPPPLPE